MFNILYRGGLFTYQCDSFDFRAGMVATFSGNRRIKVATDKDIPIGFFTNDSNGNPFESITASFSGQNQAIAVGQGEYVTDAVESGEYQINDFLYCSCNGKITNERKYWGNIIIGVVNSIEGTLVGFVTCFAKGLESDYAPVKENLILNSRYDLIKSK